MKAPEVSDVPSTQGRSTERDANSREQNTAELGAVAKEVAQLLDTKPESPLMGTPEQPEMGVDPQNLNATSERSVSTLQDNYTIPDWAPHYVNSTLWELEPGISTFRHDLTWTDSSRSISDIRPGFGFEIGDKQRNLALPGGVRPFCEINPASDDSAFWAQREGSGLGAPKTWTVMVPGNNGSYYHPYWDHNNYSDSCQEMEFALGIGSPQTINRPLGEPFHIFTEVRAARGNLGGNNLHSGIQTPSNDCAIQGRDPHSDCMGLLSFRGDGAMTLLADEPERTIPASWHTRWSGSQTEVDFDYDQCATYGLMRHAYLNTLGGKTGPLGACRTWAYDAARDGQAQNFANGRMYWHPEVANAQAHAVWGAIGNRYNSLGAENGPLRYPTSNELSCPSRGGCFFNRFETGNIYWSASTGAHGVWGAIFNVYGQNGYENSKFGLPVTSEFATPDGLQVNFEGGWIRWIRATGEVISS